MDSIGDALIPIISIGLICIGVLIIVCFVLKLYRKNKCVTSISKRCSTLNEESQCSNYGTCEEKSSIYSLSSRTGLNQDHDTHKQAQWTHNFIQKIKNIKSYFKQNNKSNIDSINLRSLSRMSSFQSSSSYTSLNSLSTILSNENLPSHQSNMILNYSLKLNKLNKSMKINLVSLENVKLPVSLIQSNLDLNVYVRIELLEPMNKNLTTKKLCAKTRLIKNRTNPIYDETFEFFNLTDLFECLMNENENEMATSSSFFRLVFNVCNSNLFGRDQIIGLCVHTLRKCDIDITDNEILNTVQVDIDSSLTRIYSKKIDLVDSKSSDVNLGQLQMTLCYNNISKTIQIHILKAFNLQLPKYFLNSDKNPSSYVKIYMIYRGQRVDKKQTKIQMESRDPIYDQQFEFNILNLLQLSQPNDNVSYEPESNESDNKNDMIVSNRISSRIQFIFLVMDWDKVEKNDVIGKVELNTQHHVQRLITHQTSKFDPSRPTEQPKLNITNTQNWFDIFYQPNQPILCTFQIRNY